MNTFLQSIDTLTISFALAAVLLPLLAFVINICLPGKTNKAAGWVSTLAIMFFIAFFSLGLHAQEKFKKNNIDAQLRIAINMMDVVPGLQPFVIVDGGPYSNDIKEFEATDIQSIQILKVTIAEKIYGNKGSNGAILITTKEYYTNSYQSNLAALSKSYRKFTNEHGYDGNIRYRLNGKVLRGRKYEIAYKLFNLSQKDIKWIRVKKYSTGGTYAAIVSIRTYF